MKLALIAALGAVMAGSLLAADDKPAPKASPKDQKEKISYAIGQNWGNMLKKESVDVDMDVLTAAIKESFAGKAKMTEQEVRETMMAFQTEMRAKQAEKQKEMGEKSKKEGETFMAENKKKEGVKSTPSGLQYKVVTAGTGPVPKPDDTVKVHYRGTLIDDMEFDNSYTRSEPITVRNMSGVIKGWIEALKMMPVGSKWQLVIPPDLGYGERGYPPKIPPNATLRFDVELLSIEKPETAAPSPSPTGKKDVVK